MEQVEMSNKYIDTNVNNGSEKWTGKNTAAQINTFWDVCSVPNMAFFFTYLLHGAESFLRS